MINKHYFISLFTFLICFLSTEAQIIESCRDTSFRMRYSSTDNVSIRQHAATSDYGSIVVGGTSKTSENKIHGLFARFDVLGNIMWSKRITVPDGSMLLREVRELQNGDFFIGAELVGNSTTKIFLARLDQNGNALWQKIYTPDSRFNQEDYCNLYSLEEGSSNSLFFSFRGSHSDFSTADKDSTYSLIVKLNGAGDIVWSKGFVIGGSSPQFPYSNPVGVYYKNGKLLVFGQLINDTSTCQHINGTITGTTFFGMGLNESDGNLQAMKSYCYSEMPTNQTISAYIKTHFGSNRLSNNDFSLFGKFYSSTNQDTYFFKAEFDENLNLFKPSAYRMPRFSSSAQINVQRNGNTNLSIMSSPSNQYWAQLDSLNQIKRQRKILLSSTTSISTSSYDFKAPNYTTYTSNYKANNKWYLEYSQLQPYDPMIDSCLGVDTSFVTVLPLRTSPINFSWRSIISNPVLASSVDYLISDQPLQQENICGQLISRCDSLRITGPDTICVAANFVNFIGLKNPDCHKRVLWQIDNSLIDSSYQANDSTLSVRFKLSQGNSPQLIRLFASAANCTIAKDTAQIILMPGLKSLPADTLICGAVNIRLTPGKWGKRYLWQDGSTDSVLIATDSGRYTVQVETFCGPMFYDTISINRALLSVGGDKIKCNSDTVLLQATPGFVSYQWSPLANISFVSDSVVNAYPVDTTRYIVTAQTKSGCKVRDTVMVNVLHSPPINLGPDTSFCNGTRFILKTSASFSSYKWSTGDTTSNINVTDAGNYWVRAWVNNNCWSSDSIILLPLYPKPIPAIAPKAVVCIGQTDTLRAAGNFSSYEWQNGSRDNFLPVSDTGRYWVTVTNAFACVGSDTASIIKLAVPPKFFLSKDTIICAGSLIELNPLQNFDRYLWNNGSVAASIEVSVAGLYTLQISDKNNCVGKDSILVTQKNCPNKIFFPTAFTPNRDGRNDLFKPFVEGSLLSYHFTVYNRWGQVVFTTADYRKGWNGMLGDLLQNTGAFVWLCQYQFRGEEKHIEKGTVLVIR